jgi:hypothetical protein
MIKDGKGGANTKTGLSFENRSSLKEVFLKLEGFLIKEDDLFLNNNKVATFFTKNKLYTKLLKPNNILYTDYISKKLIPDDCLFILNNNTLFIIEIKFQKVFGSVDEKLQTCDFKNKQYNKLLKPLNIKVKYIYLLNNWFKNEKYKDTLDYIHSVNCYYFFNEIPLSFFEF